MRFLLGTLICAALVTFAAPVGHAQTPPAFNCGVTEQGEVLVEGTLSHGDPYVEARIVFVSFPGYTSTLPTWAESFRTELQNLILTQSRGAQTVNAVIVTPPGSPNSAWVAQNPSTYYAAGSGYGGLNTEIMTAIANAIPDAWTGVEQVFVLHYQCTFPCTDPSTPATCESTCPWGGISTLANGSVPGFTGTGLTQRFYYPLVNEAPNEKFAKWVFGHEYGHKLGLWHTPGTEGWVAPADRVNIGHYDVMRSSASGVNQEGSLPYHAEQHNTLNWVPRTVISTDTEGIRIPDIRSANAQILQVNVPGSTQYFECANYQGGNIFDSKYLGTGLLIAHVISGLAWDIESAAGKFTSGLPDPVSGKDPLEANPNHYGSAADFFDGVVKTTFNPGTNPNTNLYSASQYSSPQSVKTSVAFENIREDTNGDMLLDVYVTPKQKVALPNGGETVPKGVPYTINWTLRPATALITTVDVLLSTNGGGSYTTLASGLANTGSYAWTPTATGSQFRVKVVSHDQAGGTGTDESDANFTVVDHGIWQLLTSTHPSGGRAEHGAIYDSLRSRMIVFGGHNVASNFNDVWTKSLLGSGAWQQLSTSGAAPSPRYNPAVAYDRLRDRMIVFGGRTGGFSPLSDCFALTLSGTPTWSALPTNPFFTSGGDRFGVYDSPRDRLVVVDPDIGVFALTLSGTPTWSQLTGAPPPLTGSFGYSLIHDSARDRLVTFGGWIPSNNPYIYFNTVNEFSLTTNTWTTLSATNPPHARSHAVAVYDPLRSRMVLFGGYYYEAGADHFTNDVWALPLGTTPAWTQLTPGSAAPSPRRGASGVYDSIDDALATFGGHTSWSTFVQDAHALVFPDIRPPAAVSGLAAGTGRTSAAVSWVFPGDDGLLGQAVGYDMRYAPFPINETNWYSAASVAGPVYDPAGTPWCVTVDGLSQCTWYYFAVKHLDDAGNWSAISNVASSKTKCSGNIFVICEFYRAQLVEDGESPAELAFAPPSPNPTEHSATFEFAVPRDLAGSRLELTVFDVLGRRIRGVEKAEAAVGTFTVAWDLRSEVGTRVSPGLYFARLVVGGRKITRSVLVR